MVVLENGSSQEANDRSMLMKLHKFQAPLHSKQSDLYQNQRQSKNGNEGQEVFKREMSQLEEMFSKLNPMAQEFVPPSLATSNMTMKINGGYIGNSIAAANVMYLNVFANDNGNTGQRRVMFSR